MPRQRRDAVEHRPAGRGQPEHAGHLRDQDVHGDAGEKADHDRRRQQIGDPAEPKQAAHDENDANSQRQRRREGLILRRAGGSHQRKASGEDRRDGGIGAAGQEAVAAEHGKADRSRDEGEETDLRREAAEAGGRHLLGNRNRRQRQARDQVARQVAQPERGQRTEDRPVGFFGAVSGNIRGHRSRALCAEEYPCEYSDIARPKASDVRSDAPR